MTPRSALVVGVLVFLDQISKYFVSSHLKLNESIAVLQGIFHITLIHNRGAAFGIFKGMLPVFIFLSMITIVLAALYAKRFRYTHAYARVGLLLILAGAVGNLIDRIRLGYVVDFIDVKFWSVFNIADTTITIGAACLVYHILVISRKIPPPCGAG